MRVGELIEIIFCAKRSILSTSNFFQLSINMKEEKELILYPNKNGTVKTLLEEAAKQIELNPEEGSGQLRILEVCSHKVMPGPREDDSLECK